MLAILLLASTLLLAWFVRKDAAEYAAFKAISASEDRQRAFRRWTVRSFLVFGLWAVAALALLGRVDALVRMPPEFAGLAEAIGHRLSPNSGAGGVSTGFLIGLSGALLAGGLLGGLLAARKRQAAAKSTDRLVLGDIAPLFPRNRAERKWTVLLAINSGPSEELFFRLMLPLLIAQISGDVLLAVSVSALVFGLVHFYQGWVGVAATTATGILFTFLYLATGSIWVPALLHSLMNLNSLWLRPLLRHWRHGEEQPL